jgi:hypothetical protein
MVYFEWAEGKIVLDKAKGYYTIMTIAPRLIAARLRAGLFMGSVNAL